MSKFGAIDQETVLRVQVSTIRECPLNVRDDATSPCRVTTLLGLSTRFSFRLQSPESNSYSSDGKGAENGLESRRFLPPFSQKRGLYLGSPTSVYFHRPCHCLD
jgi:hypothetical protein